MAGGAPGRRAAREDLRRRGYLRWEQPYSWTGHLALAVGLPVGIVFVATAPGADDATRIALTVAFVVVFAVGLLTTAVSMVQRFRRLGLRSGGERATGQDMWFAFFMPTVLALQGTIRLGDDVTGLARAAGVMAVGTGSVLAAVVVVCGCRDVGRSRAWRKRRRTLDEG